MLYFPHPLSADHEGLLAIGGDLNPERLLLAYTFGIFPWYNQGPILWWFTFPRSILFPKKVKISKSMKSLIERKRPWHVTMNQSFNQVINLCAKAKRKDQLSTWISGDISKAYSELHKLGYAHSLEVWQGQDLIGGLYGVTKGKIFFGESMFSTVSNSSKYALVHLCQYLESLEFTLIDCQQDTPHMKTMGSELMTKENFWRKVKFNSMVKNIELSSDSFDQWLNSKY